MPSNSRETSLVVPYGKLNNVKTGSGAQPASYPTRIMEYFLGGKTAGEWNWPLASILYLSQDTPTPPYVLMP
jgi:hypothetical protein